MLTLTNDMLINITKQVAIYFGIPVLCAGLLGNILNIIVFLSLKTFRQNSCAFFLIIMSFLNIGQLLTSLVSRIFITGFNNNWTETSISFCKFRNYCLQVCALTSSTCMCLATIDQFLVTSLRSRWQQLFNIKRAYILCIVFFIIWLLHGVPTLIWFSPVISRRTNDITCTIINLNYQQYFTYGYTLILTGMLPILITVVFGTLAYRNVRQIRFRRVPIVRRELDKQLTSMVLIQVVHNFFVVVPYVTILIILTSTTPTNYPSNYMQIVLAIAITGFIYYLYFASPFYIYICVSKRFRQQLNHVLFGRYKKRPVEQIISINQILPVFQEF
ncbi:unnamed protein product [Adineta steineri]|uniref:G-protein coupled receptors family 1 profile domain-containing protein n=1 Tax=Adineta steineri TaxID=433720 RepID=A0A814S4H6_9BILA|nr:unnamed protein product [Adineta steineri]CAF1142505.1 unnamed protein product [Adineta steineri]